MSYITEFHQRLTDLEKRAQAAGTNLTEICRETKIARSTPDRWRKTVPKTIEAMALLEDAVKRHEEKNSAGVSTH
ncbi:MAG: hypothetical protein AB9M53_00815 [Leptothrix sp. (in: b-proteobacteria)]